MGSLVDRAPIANLRPLQTGFARHRTVESKPHALRTSGRWPKPYWRICRENRLGPTYSSPQPTAAVRFDRLTSGHFHWYLSPDLLWRCATDQPDCPLTITWTRPWC